METLRGPRCLAKAADDRWPKVLEPSIFRSLRLVDQLSRRELLVRQHKADTDCR
jgi:hypothetical protein